MAFSQSISMCITTSTETQKQKNIVRKASSQQFSVKKLKGELVLPCEPTPSHTLNLTALDKVFKDYFIYIFFVYKHGQEPAKVIRRALAKALVSYYPLAGRIVRSPQGENVHVNCSGEGMYLGEAVADCTLDDIMDLLLGNNFSSDLLLPLPDKPIGMPFMLQVTQFACGGFILTLGFDHVMLDGKGITQFMKAIADIVRGLEGPTISPIWLREQVPAKPLPKSPMEPYKPLGPGYMIVDISQDHINNLKNQFMEQTGKSCTTLDIAVAELWKCRIQGLNLDPEVEAHLGIVADTRKVLADSFLEGYYGNCAIVMSVVAPSRKIADGSIVEIVSLIKEAKASLQDQFAMWLKGNVMKPRNEDGDFLLVTDWRNVGFTDIDFGWGGPVYFAPALPRPELWLPCTTIVVPCPEGGARLFIHCADKEHFDEGRMSFCANVKVVPAN